MTKNKYEINNNTVKVYYRNTNNYFECDIKYLNVVKKSTWRDTGSGARGYIDGKEVMFHKYIGISNKQELKNKVEVENGVVKVYFKSGDYFLCDEEDLDVLKGHAWHKASGGKGYASARIDGKETTFHTLVCKAKEGEEIDHINRNSLDNRKCNLRSVTHRENSLNKDFYWCKRA